MVIMRMMKMRVMIMMVMAIEMRNIWPDKCRLGSLLDNNLSLAMRMTMMMRRQKMIFHGRPERKRGNQDRPSVGLLWPTHWNPHTSIFLPLVFLFPFTFESEFSHSISTQHSQWQTWWKENFHFFYTWFRTRSFQDILCMLVSSELTKIVWGKHIYSSVVIIFSQVHKTANHLKYCWTF